MEQPDVYNSCFIQSNKGNSRKTKEEKWQEIMLARPGKDCERPLRWAYGFRFDSVSSEDSSEDLTSEGLITCTLVLEK